MLPGSWVPVLALPWALCMALSWSRGELLRPAPARLVSEVPGRPHTQALLLETGFTAFPGLCIAPSASRSILYVN